MNLYEVLAKIDNPEDMRDFFEDLCTFREIEQMQQRVECAQHFFNNETYTDISKKTEASSATLSRVSRCIQRGSGGYSRVLKNILND